MNASTIRWLIEEKNALEARLEKIKACLVLIGRLSNAARELDRLKALTADPGRVPSRD